VDSAQIAAALVALAVLVASAHLLGHLFVRLRQPRLIGEILVGILFGPFVLGRVAPSLSRALFGDAGGAADANAVVLGFVYWLGLLLLMFVSGAEVRKVLSGENRRPTAWILGIGTPLPFFIALAVGSFLPLDALAGPAKQESAVLLVLAIAVAVTSIPVISRIFHDLGIMHTRFASLVLGAAILEDLALWAVLAIATALAASGGLGEQIAATLTSHIAATVGYLFVGLLIAPKLLKRLHVARWNVLQRTSPVTYAFLLMLTYASVAALLEVNIVFAAFLAGFGLVGGISGSERVRFADALDAIAKVSFAVFIPIYFVVVGSKLELGEGFSFGVVAAFLIGSSMLCLLSIGLAARLAGFRGLEIVNLAVTANARGGPGIVLASVAYEAGIINGTFFTTLVLTAIVTSQAAGVWLGYVLRKGWPLLSEEGDADQPEASRRGGDADQPRGSGRDADADHPGASKRDAEAARA
jgi:Kef-type K+ transport system membrane component KefB